MAPSTISHRERLETCLSGEIPDRVPVALWRHFPVDDQTPEGLAASTAAFQRMYDFDLIKVTPASSFCLKDWGAEDEWRGNPEGTREYTRRVIQHPEDWAKLPLLDPTSGHLGDQIHALRILTAEFAPHTPVVQTIFSPLAQAKNLVGPEKLLIHLRRYPEALHAGLERITQVTVRFLEELRKTAIDGIFYAVQHAQYGLLSEEEFEIFGRYYDLRVLEVAKGWWLNILHLHGNEVMFDKVTDYPCSVINWHDRQTTPPLSQAKQAFSGVVCGGLRQWESLVLGTPDTIFEEAREAILSTGGERFILGTGCVLPIIAPNGNILTVRQAVEQISLP
ncbi:MULTISPECIES: uroporphyrinogen decarboxylase family protein [Anaerolinea]|uniref:uroporphyrinogen decarboxylase family protein n=1 Tax=Anaerolinea TaxID=233189 RepID=UPI00263445B4|nr:uroporphyrinogen decarboxylase family protein [Anaerolinea thermophila]